MGLQNASSGDLFVTPIDPIDLKILDRKCIHSEAKAFNLI